MPDIPIPVPHNVPVIPNAPLIHDVPSVAPEAQNVAAIHDADVMMNVSAALQDILFYPQYFQGLIEAVPLTDGVVPPVPPPDQPAVQTPQ